MTDNGGGVAEQVLTHIFDPFFTTKEVGQGTGLGLSISYSIIQAMNGALQAENVIAPDGSSGACFRVTLPARSVRSEPLERDPERPALPERLQGSAEPNA